MLRKRERRRLQTRRLRNLVLRFWMPMIKFRLILRGI
ncbi:MAG: hypothetical protein MRERC_19c001 [Mycoplasmataceae bacterium RC_NB112A]|nr:MAG: hypothetical protein MRERC_19c001 [Mycoplasmataceae bacterium RC_NB112A]